MKNDTEEPSGEIQIPLKFKPILHSKIWGGTRIKELFGKGAGPEDVIGESWELSDNPTEISVIDGGEFDGKSFRDIFKKYSGDIMGANSSDNYESFPLLIKFIDASKDLSVQVHPGEGSPLGDPKTEAWYVADAEEGAEIIVGINSDKSQEEILEDLKTSKVREVLNSIPVERGDILFIPAGTVHAITEGTLIYEVQQNSDTTFRLYDWDRLDDSGRPRALHVEQASQVLDFYMHDDHKIKTLSVNNPSCSVGYLVACDYFVMLKYSNISDAFKIDPKNRFRVITCMRGSSQINTGNGGCSIKEGDTILVPASCKDITVKNSASDTELIMSHIPDIYHDVAEPLLQAGFSREDIELLGGGRKLKW